MDRTTWHHVDDCLPPFRVNVLVLRALHPANHMMAWMEGTGIWRMQGSGSDFAEGEIVFWRHLPTPPEGK